MAGRRQTVFEDVRHVLRDCLTNFDSEDELPPSFVSEFPSRPRFAEWWDHHLQAHQRKFKAAMKMVFEPRQMLTLTASFGTVWAIGFYEGLMLTRDAHRNLRFASRYGLAQIIPSIIWYTKDPVLLAQSYGLDPSVVLRTFKNTVGERGRVNAATRLRILQAQCIRSVIAGFLGIAQIFHLVQAFSDASDSYDDRILGGREPFFSGTRERVIRLAGKSSDVTNLSMMRFGDHMVPIAELPGMCKGLVDAHSKNLLRPTFWHIPNDTYGRPASWGASRDILVSSPNDFDLENAKFKIGREWTIPTAADFVAKRSARPSGGQKIVEDEGAQRVLIVEADSSVGEQALALGSESANDMTISEAALAFRFIEKLARRQGALRDVDRVVRVLLADSSSEQMTGGGRTYSLREHVVQQDSADILIDAKLPLLKAIVEWAERTNDRRWGAEEADSKRQIFFDTSNREYFNTVRSILSSYGWEVLDGSWHESLRYKDVPVIVYDNSTAATVNTMRSLLEKKDVPPYMLCALLDQYEGQGDLNRLTCELGMEPGDVSSICSAVIYDYLFQSVRVLVRQGYSREAIQTFLDEEIGRIGDEMEGQ